MASGAPAPEVIAALGGRSTDRLREAPWLDDVIARYNLRPPPGR